ncbi:MAG TPA: ABC transporter permease subunit [Streptosporangiaceae bacterium]|nr:ABC transporter permease subunit [Streptosporangiaceae bacterium]
MTLNPAPSVDVQAREALRAAAIKGLDNLETGGTAKRGGFEPRQFAAKVWAGLWPKALAVAIVLGVWQLVAISGWKSLVLKGPGPVLSDLWQLAQHGQIWSAIGITMQRALYGYIIALLIGTAIGIVVARIAPLRVAIGSIISALQTMPSIAWFPFAIILFGQTDAAIVFVMALGAAPSIANGLITGIDYTPPLLLRAGKTMGLRGVDRYRFLILPASLPAYVSGLREGWAFAWRSLMAGELLVIILGQVSVGQLLNTFQSNLDFTGATAMIIVVLIIGVCVDAVFSKADLTIRKRRGLLENES